MCLLASCPTTTTTTTTGAMPTAAICAGDLVEVSQAGAGYWYLGKLVDCKPGLWLVEYAQGLEEVMLESIPLGSQDARVRPRPPPCSSISTANWQRGLWVDAYQDSWREGVLMGAPEAACAQVFFPDKNEHHHLAVDKLRVSQVWDEGTNLWSIKGYYALAELDSKQMKPQITYQRKRKRKESPLADELQAAGRMHPVDAKRSRMLAQAIAKAEEQYVEVRPATDFSVSRSDVTEDRLDEKRPIKVEHLTEYEQKPAATKPAAPPVCHMNTQSEEGLFVEEHGRAVGIDLERSQQSGSAKDVNDDGLDSRVQQDTLKETREQAIKYLEGSGWKKGYRARQRENRISMEAYYVAPDGTSYHSLTSACNAWMQQNKDVSKPVKDAMRSYQLQIVFRRKYGALEREQETEEGAMAGSRRRRLRPSRPLSDDRHKRRSGSECRLEALLLARDSRSSKPGDAARRTTIFSWLIDLGVVEEKETVTYMNKDTQLPWKGQLTRDGVLCQCCKAVFTMPNFQVHAGNKVHRTAAQLFVDDGRSIMDCQRQALKKLEESKAQQRPEEAVVLDESDECCGLCAEGGELICCDHCPATFHLRCVLLKSLPEGDWFCPKCRCPVCNVSLFDGRQTRFCNQCERSYHLECTNDGGIMQGANWFCSASCHKIFGGLRQLVGIPNPMHEGYSWTLLRSAEHEEDVAQDTVAEHSSKLALALSVMQECFSPMVDPRRKIDVIGHILKNCSSDLRRLDFRGFYTVLLEKEELISVAAIRVHGAHVAEMPLIGTRLQYRRQGMCRRLLDVIEQLLRTLGVDSLILPSVPELLDTWVGTFGFQKVTAFQAVRLLELNVVAFPGTKLLHKPLTWLNLCRKAAPPLAEKPWSPGSQLNLGMGSYSPRRVPKAQRHLAVEGRNHQVINDAFVTKTRSNRLVKPSQRVAEALASRKSFQQPVEGNVEEEQSIELDTVERNELAFLKMGAQQPAETGAGSGWKKVLEAPTCKEAADNVQSVVLHSASAVSQGTLRTCGQCGTSSTPMWRKGPVNSTSLLCNACGIRFKKRLLCL